MARADWSTLLRFKLTLLKMDPHRTTTILYLQIIISGDDNFLRLAEQLWREHDTILPYIHITIRFRSNNRILLKWCNNMTNLRQDVYQVLNIPLFVPPFF